MISYLLNLLKLKKRFNFAKANSGLSAGRQGLSADKHGFTLIELIVSIGIMVMVTTVILANYSTFNKRIKLEGVTQEIVSIVREAQAYGIGNKSITGGNFAYGVHFDIDYPGQISIFSDDNDNGVYNTGEEVETFNIESSDRIWQICVNQKTQIPDSCPGVGSVDTIDVVYKRSKIYADIESYPAKAFISDAVILFRSAGETANGVKIIIWKSGQVSVEAE